jgi:hypothetical protein
MRQAVGAEFFVDAFVFAFAKEVEINIAERRRKVFGRRFRLGSRA